MQVQFENVVLEVREEPTHDWILETALVAEGYGITKSAVIKNLQRNLDEFIEGKHFIKGEDNLSSPLHNAQPNQIFFTKKGVIRLGFFIKSDRAKKFRDWAEDLIVSKQSIAPVPMCLEDAIIQQLQVTKAMRLEQEALKAKQTEHDNRITLIEAKTATRPDYFTVMGYAILKHLKVGLQDAARIGQKAARICKEKGYSVDRIHDARFGQVGSYPQSVLEDVFAPLF